MYGKRVTKVFILELYGLVIFNGLTTDKWKP
jgi:hypothetical protein